MTITYRDEEDTVPAVRDAPQEPKDARTLDETADFLAAHVVVSESALTAMTLGAAAAWGRDAFPTTFRMLWVGDAESGKTTGMNVTAALSPTAIEADGTYADLRSAIAEVSNTPENTLRVFTYDEIGGNYGDDGQNRGGNKTLDKLLRRGYKKNAKDGWSVNRTSRKFSLFFPVYMSGRNVSIPVDIRGRTIVIPMSTGDPQRYFDIRESEKEAEELGNALGAAVKSHMDELEEFRARGIHPKLVRRRLEVWEPLFAVAWVLGGQRWLNRCLTAFLELSTSSEQEVLSPRQQVLRRMAGLLDTVFREEKFIGGLALADELRRSGDSLYEDRSDAAIARLISEAMPVTTSQVRVGGQKIRGYFAKEIRQAWEDIRPGDMEDAEIPEERNPFAVTDDDSDVLDVVV